MIADLLSAEGIYWTELQANPSSVQVFLLGIEFFPFELHPAFITLSLWQEGL
jgi:hypothetical protein